MNKVLHPHFNDTLRRRRRERFWDVFTALIGLLIVLIMCLACNSARHAFAVPEPAQPRKSAQVEALPTTPPATTLI